MYKKAGPYVHDILISCLLQREQEIEALKAEVARLQAALEAAEQRAPGVTRGPGRPALAHS